jgi:hypothetical protein
MLHLLLPTSEVRVVAINCSGRAEFRDVLALTRFCILKKLFNAPHKTFPCSDPFPAPHGVQIFKRPRRGRSLNHMREYECAVLSAILRIKKKFIREATLQFGHVLRLPRPRRASKFEKNLRAVFEKSIRYYRNRSVLNSKTKRYKKKLLPFPIRLPNFQLSELLAYSCVSARYTSPPPCDPACLSAAYGQAIVVE